MSDDWFDDYAQGEFLPEPAGGEVDAYCHGYVDGKERMATYMAEVTKAADAVGDQACHDAWWQGFAEGLCARSTSPYRRQHGRGLGRGRPCRSLTRPPAAKPVSR